MKYPTSFARIAALSFVLCAISSNLLGQTTTNYYWDPTFTAPNGNGTLEGGGGVWNNSLFNFTTSPTDDALVSHVLFTTPSGVPTSIAASANTVTFGGDNGGIVVIGAGSGATVANVSSATPNTLGTSTISGVGVNALFFQPLVVGGTNYTLTGSQIRFINASDGSGGSIGGSINVAAGVTATINSSMQGNTVGGITATGAGTVGQIDSQVTITGGGILNLAGGNGNMGFDITGGTTVNVTGGSFSGFNLNSINDSSVLNVSSSGALQAPSSFRNTSGTGTLNLANSTQTISTLGGAITVLNSNANGVLGLTLVGNTLTHTGSITNGTGKLSLATTGVFAQGPGFNSSNSFVTQTFAGANTYTGFTSLGRGTVALDFSNAVAPATNILYNGVTFSPSGDDGKLIIARPTATINTAANAAIGSLTTLVLTGKASTQNSQQFNGLKLTGGAANILINPNATLNTVTLDLGSTIERSAGSLVNFGTTNATTVLSATAFIQSTAGTASGVLKDANGVAFAVIGGRDWAAKNAAGTNIVTGNTASATNGTIFTSSTATGFTANADIAIPVAGGAGNDVRMSATTTISTLKYGDSGRTGINLGGNTLTTGGILLSQANISSGNFINNGSITSPGSSGSDIVLYSNTANFFGLNASLVNGAAATGFTKGGNGIVLQNANNTFTGFLTVNEGGLVVRGTNTASAININGSQTNLMGIQLPTNGVGTAGSYLQLGNTDDFVAVNPLAANSSFHLGAGAINLGPNALLGIKRSDSFTLDNNTLGLGGITQGWSGTTTLVSAATPKYNHAGDTTITAGTLRLDYSASNTGILSDSSRLALGGGTLELTSTVARTHNEVVRDFSLLSGASTVTRTGLHAGVFSVNSIPDQSVAGSTVNFTATGIASYTTGNTNGLMGTRARFTVGSAGNYDWAVGGGNIAAFSAYTGLTGAISTSNVGLVDGDVTATVAPGQSVNSLKLSNSSGSTQTLNVTAANTLFVTSGGLLVTGNDAVTIDNGTLRSNANGGSSSDLLIHQYNNGGLTINSVIANSTTGNATLTKSGTGTLTLVGSNLYTGQTFLNGGVTSISSNANLGALASGQQLNLNNATLKVTADVILSNGAVGTNNRNIVLNGVGGTIDVDATRTLTVGGSITGPGGLTKIGTGILDVRNASGYSGPTNVVAGTYQFGAGANPSRSDFTVGATGTVNLNGFGNFIGSLSGAGTVTNTGAAATLTVGSTHTNSTFSGQLTNTTNALNIDKMGAGTLTITGEAGSPNNYTGSTTISGGTLALSGVGALPDTTAVNVSSAAGTFDISGIGGTSETIRTLAGVNASSVVLGDKNLAVGDDFGTVSITGSTTTGTSVTVASVPSYLTVGSLMLGRRVDAISGTTITLNGAANIGVTTNAVSVNVYADTGDTTYAGVISGVGGSISKDGDANLTLTGANTYTGLTTVDRGVLTVTNSSGLGTADAGTFVNYNGNTSGGRLDLNGVTLTEAITIQGGRFGNNFGVGLQAVGGTTSNITNTVTLTGVAIPNYVTTTNSEFRIGASNTNTVLNLNGGVTRSGLAAANAGTLLFVPGTGATINVNGAIDNNGGGLGFGGSGTTVLNAVSTEVGSVGLDFTGTPGIFGTLRLGVNNALPSGSNLRIGYATGSLPGTNTDPNGPLGRLDMAGFNLTVARLDGSRGNVVTGSPNNSSNRVITNSTAGSSTLTIGTAGTAIAQQVFEGVIENGTGGGTVAITKILGSTQTFSGDVANTYTGLTTVNGGSLVLAKNAGLNAIAGNVVIGDGATTAGFDVVQLTNSNQIADTSLVSFNGTGTNAGVLRLFNQNETIGGLSSITAGAGIVENGNGAAGTSVLTVNVASGTNTFSGILRNNGGAGAGALAFTKDGAGTQVLTGASTFSGPTIINAGTLLANNTGVTSALGSSNVTVNAGGTFGGTGSITGDVVLAGGLLSPGASIDTLTTGSLSGTGSLLIEYNVAALGQKIDMLNIIGNIDAAGITLNFANLGALDLVDDSYVFATYTGTRTGEFIIGLDQPSGYSIVYDYNSLKQIALVSAVPEPGTIALLVVAGIGGGLYRRSRNLKKEAAKA